jgi:DNA-3-methyladenine glycosylase II
MMDYTIATATLKTADPILGRVIEQVGTCGLNQVQRSGSVFDALSRSIIYQQLSTKAATTIYGRFLQLYSDPEGLVPEAVLTTSDETLREAGLSRQKITYLKDLAQHTLDGLPTIEELEELEDETIIQTLTKVKGVGRWTVQMLLIFRLNRLDVLPVDDLGVRSGIRRIYELDDLPNKKQIEALGQKWKPYCSIASWYLWRSLELP